MTAETTQERRPRHRHFFDFSPVFVVFPLETHGALFLIDALDPLVADRDAAGVTGEVAHHGPGVAQGRTAEDVPVLACQLQTPLTASLDGPERLGPVDFLICIPLLKPPQQDRAEDSRHQPDRKKVIVPCLTPTACGKIPSARTDQHVKMWMPVERSPPSVEHTEEAPIHAPVVALEKLEGLGSSGKELVGSNCVVALEKIVKLFRNGENHMKMRAIWQAIADLFGPLRLPRSEAIGTVAVATGTGEPFDMATILTTGAVVSQGAFATERHQIEGGILVLAQTSRPEVAPLAQNAIDGRFDAV